MEVDVARLEASKRQVASKFRRFHSQSRMSFGFRMDSGTFMPSAHQRCSTTALLALSDFGGNFEIAKVSVGFLGGPEAK